MNAKLVLLIKMTIGFIIGMLAAMLLNLPYFYTAGVIAVLSLEPTRKMSLDSGIKRIIDSIFGLGLSVLLFYIFGYEVWVLFVFVAFFIPLSFLLKIDKGIVVALVLVSQIYLEADISYAINALYILGIGILVAFLLNLYMPTNKKLVFEILEIDQMINDIIQEIANDNLPNFNPATEKLYQAYQDINIELENINLPLTISRLKYVEMRIEQTAILKRINNILIEIPLINEKQIILTFLKEFDNKIGENNYASSLNKRLDEIFQYFRQTELPQNRDLFEQRAQLYYVLLEINQFLNLKLIYHENVEGITN